MSPFTTDKICEDTSEELMNIINEHEQICEFYRAINNSLN